MTDNKKKQRQQQQHRKESGVLVNLMKIYSIVRENTRNVKSLTK